MKQRVAVRVLRLDPVAQGNLIAFASVHVETFGTVHRVRIVSDPGQGLTIQGPQMRRHNAPLNPTYDTLVQFTKPVRVSIMTAVLSAYRAQFGQERGL